MARKNRTDHNTETAAEQLAKVLAEIDELGQPLAPATEVGADLDALTARLVDRAHRCQALELVVPALRRAALVEQRPALVAARDVEDAAQQRAVAALKIAEAASEKAIATLTEARYAQMTAADRYNFVHFEIYKLDEATRQHDVRHSPAPPPVTIPTAFNAALLDPFAAG